MNYSNRRPGNDKMAVCRKTYHKEYYAKNKEKILARQKRYRTENAEILKSRRKSWHENNRERLASSRNYQRHYCKNSRERMNEYWRCYYAKNKEQMRQRLRKRHKLCIRLFDWFISILTSPCSHWFFTTWRRIPLSPFFSLDAPCSIQVVQTWAKSFYRVPLPFFMSIDTLCFVRGTGEAPVFSLF